LARRRAKLARMQAEFAHAARVSMLGELTASIAHEVNQPLGAILTSGETAMRWLNRPEPDLGELRALAVRTVSDARRAGEIIRRIRSMAAHEEPELLPISLNDVVEEVMMFLAPELRRQVVEATPDLAPGLPFVRADRVQLQQVFANLAVNALQAMAATSERRLLIRTTLVDHQTLRPRCRTQAPAYQRINGNGCFKVSSRPRREAWALASPSAAPSSKPMAATWASLIFRAIGARDSILRCPRLSSRPSETLRWRHAANSCTLASGQTALAISAKC
jgi:signal transduction histidine kinase